MSDLRYLDRRDVASLIAYAKRAFRDHPDYDIDSSQAFRVRGADGEALLEAAFAAPHWDYYPSLADKAAVLHDRLNRNHPFLDGNKRFALTAMLVFLGRNNAVFVANDDELLAFSVDVATGRLDQDAAREFAALRAFERDWSAAEIAAWVLKVGARPDHALSIGEALRSWQRAEHPRFIELPSADIWSVLVLAAPAT